MDHDEEVALLRNCLNNLQLSLRTVDEPVASALIQNATKDIETLLALRSTSKKPHHEGLACDRIFNSRRRQVARPLPARNY
jgi:hypothetical protein